MKTLWSVSVVSVLCTVVMWLFAVPQLVLTGVIEVGSHFEMLMVYPTLIGLPCSLVGALVGIACVVRQRARRWATNFMAIGQVVTVALAGAIVVWAFGFATTGWELITLPMSLMIGQIVVVVGLIKAGRPRMPGPVRASS